MDEFITFLVGGLIILAVILAVILAMIIYVPGIQKTEIGPTGYITDRGTGLYLVGYEEKTTSKVFSFDFDIDYLKKPGLYELGNAEISSGVLFGSNSWKYSMQLKDPSGMKLYFSVVRTNGYAPLIVKVNGNIVEKRVFEPGDYNIEIEDVFLEDETEIEISTPSSGPRFWAPSLYALSDIKIMAYEPSVRGNEFTFFLDEEYRNFDSGRVELNLDANMGSLVVDLNSQAIHSGAVRDVHSIALKKDDLWLGENKMQLKAEENSVLSGKAKVIIFYKSTARAAVETTLNATREEYEAMKSGYIIINIADVQKPGIISAKVMYNNQELFYGTLPAEEGQLKFPVKKENIRPGPNVLVIDSPNNAIFSISKIRLETK